MKDFLIALCVAAIVSIFSQKYDEILLWLYDNDGFLSGAFRYLLVIGLLRLFGVFGASDKGKNQVGDSAA